MAVDLPDDMHVAPVRRPRGRPGYSRDEVLKRAVDVFNRQGYDATSIADLSRDLGVTKSAIFHHFDSKESILAAALDEALTEIGRVVADARSADGASAYQRLRAAVQASVQILVDHLPVVTLLLRVRGNSAMEQMALRRRRDIDNQLAELVAAAVAEGDLREDISPEVISRLVFGMVNSLTDWYRPAGTLDGASLAAGVTAVLFDGLHKTKA
ncbi:MULTISPECIES: TetR/AcrR family transcriptional regulator [unclassified Mycolicibacterium]|uniref:TetR/AcrR family transcriptional regulator n=1 Tax=unclassified Mycolicibacterium TaxID=2636767 RepID=UPI0028161045|nr:MULTISPECIES: TetR/AcrR family transcriptional regulator [unclassified Mycolicibacterium]